MTEDTQQEERYVPQLQQFGAAIVRYNLFRSGAQDALLLLLLRLELHLLGLVIELPEELRLVEHVFFGSFQFVSCHVPCEFL